MRRVEFVNEYHKNLYNAYKKCKADGIIKNMKELSEILSINNGTLARYIYHGDNPSIKNKKKIAEYLNVDYYITPKRSGKCVTMADPDDFCDRFISLYKEIGEPDIYELEIEMDINAYTIKRILKKLYKTPGYIVVKATSNYFDVNIDWILNRTDIRYNISENYLKLSKPNQQYICDLVKTMLEKEGD